jgi:hypothetical protein
VHVGTWHCTVALACATRPPDISSHDMPKLFLAWAGFEPKVRLEGPPLNGGTRTQLGRTADRGSPKSIAFSLNHFFRGAKTCE